VLISDYNTRVMTPERAKLLGELLEELAADARGFIPDEAWVPSQKAFSLPYVELAVVRRALSGPVEILLKHRSDKNWNGWHIPGGVWRTKQTLEECIAVLRAQELGEGVRTTLLAKGDWEKWHDHPYGHPISHIAICRGDNIIESETLKWFATTPDEIIVDGGHHARFIESVLGQTERENLV